jgi:hypothetical protein
MPLFDSILVPICGGILVSLGIIGAVMLAGWSWLWSSGPSQANLYKKLRAYLQSRTPNEVAQAIKAMKAEVKKWKGGGHIAEAARTAFLKNCDLALLKVYKNKSGAIDEFMDALQTLLKGLEGLVWLGLYLELINGLFTSGAPGALSLLKGLAQMAKLTKIVKLIEQIEKLDKVKDKAEKAKKLKELKGELDKIKKKVPATGVSMGPTSYPPVATGDFTTLGTFFRGLVTSPASALTGCSPIVWLFGLSGIFGCLIITAYVVVGGFDLLQPSEESAVIAEEPAEVAAVDLATPEPLPTSTELPTATPTPIPSPIDVIMGYGPFTEEQKAQIMIAYLLDPEGDWIAIINSPMALTDILGHAGIKLSMSRSAVDRTFNNSLFPCDSEITGGFVACAPGAEPIPAGDVIMLLMVLGDDVPMEDPDHFYTFAAVLDADGETSNNFRFQPPFNWDYWQGTDRWYILDWVPDMNAWFLDVTDINSGTFTVPSRARAVVMENLIAFFIPADEFSVERPGYRLSAFGHDGTYALEVSSGDVTGADPTEPLTLIAEEAVTIDQ